MKKGTFYTIIFVISTIAVAFDQFIKGIVNYFIGINSSIEIIKGFFSITNAHNYGAAWSILWEQREYIIAVTVVALIFVIILLFRENNFQKFKTIYYGLLIGGILGNLIDRIILGYVVDYLDFNFFGFDYPIFNLSDTFIVISILMICIECFFPFNNKQKYIEQEVEVLDFDK